LSAGRVRADVPIAFADPGVELADSLA